MEGLPYLIPRFFDPQSGKILINDTDIKQRQRFAIARALVRKPDVYVFDDSFSALDFKTDAMLLF